MAERFNDGIIDLSSLREKRQQEKKQDEAIQVEYSPDAILASIPEQFKGQDEEGNEKDISVVSVAVMPDVIYLVLSDGTDQPFLMLGKHVNNEFTQELTQATEEDLEEYNKLVAQYREAAVASVEQEIAATRQAQLQEMLDKAESDEEREQIRAMMNGQN